MFDSTLYVKSEMDYRDREDQARHRRPSPP